MTTKILNQCGRCLDIDIVEPSELNPSGCCDKCQEVLDRKKAELQKLLAE